MTDLPTYIQTYPLISIYCRICENILSCVLFASFDTGSFFYHLGPKIIKPWSAIIVFNVENQSLFSLK